MNHSDFWSSTVAPMVAEHFQLPVKRLLNLPYCQRRARIVEREAGIVVYYGEKQSKSLLKLISRTVKLSNRIWQFDEHEQRLDYDVFEFQRLLRERSLLRPAS
jgi:hypothetical protein